MLPLPLEAERRFSRGDPFLGVSQGAAVLMWGLGLLDLRPWIRELILGSETLSSPRIGHLLKVSQAAQVPETRVETAGVN